MEWQTQRSGGLHWSLLLAILFFGVKGLAQKPELVVPIGHTDRIYSVALSPENNFVLTGGEDRTAKLWNLEGREIQTFQGHNKAIRAVAFSPDGNYVLTGSEDYTIKLWNLEGVLLQTFIGHTDGILAIAFSQNGQRIISGSRDSTARVWDLAGNEITKTAGTGSPVCSVTFSPNGRRFLIGNGDGSASLFDLKGNKIRVFERRGGAIRSITFSKNGRRILLGSSDRRGKQSATLLDYRGKELQSFSGNDKNIRFAFTQNSNETFQWSPEKYSANKSNKNETILSVDFSKEAPFVLAGFPSGVAKLYGLDGKEILSFSGNSSKVNSVAFSPDGRKVLIGHGEILSTTVGLKLWDLQETRFQNFTGHKDHVNSVCFSPNGNQILTGSFDGTVKLWDLDGNLILSFGGLKNGSIESVAFSPDASQIFVGSFDYTAKLWDLQRKDSLIFAGHNLSVQSVDFSPNGEQLLTGSWDKTAKLWDLVGNEIRTFSGHKSWINSVSFSPNGKQVLTGSWDKTVKLWDLLGNEIQTLNGHLDKINSVVFSPVSNHILSGSSDHTAILWDLQGNQLQTFAGHRSEVNSVSFSPDGNYVISGSSDHTAKLWDLQGNELATLIAIDSTDWIFTNPENYYMSSKGGAKALHFKIGLQAYGFDQFDLRLNRPDIILEQLPIEFAGKAERVEQYRNAYRKRLQKMGFTEDMLSDDYQVPECVLAPGAEIPFSTTDSMLSLPILATDSVRALDRINVYVNGVPIYGSSGISLRAENTQVYRSTLSIPLAPGKNKIQVSALNQGGAESLKTTNFVDYEVPERKPDLYLLTIGVSDYVAEDMDLTFAAKDARDVDSLFQTSEAFDTVRSRILTDSEVSKTNILALRKWLENSRVDDQVMIFVSGHGMLDENYDFYYGTHDMDFRHPAEKGILYEEIEGLLDGIPARKKLLLMDACHSGEFDKEVDMPSQADLDSLQARGVNFFAIPKSPGEQRVVLGLQNSFQIMQQLFVDLRRGSGTTVISSSSGGQFSYEKDEWANGAFTYTLLHGLTSMAADANQNGEVSAGELLKYMRVFVPRLTRNQQQPTFRQENLEYDFRVW